MGVIHRPPPHVLGGAYRFNSDCPVSNGMKSFIPAQGVPVMQARDFIGPSRYISSTDIAWNPSDCGYVWTRPQKGSPSTDQLVLGPDSIASGTTLYSMVVHARVSSSGATYGGYIARRVASAGSIRIGLDGDYVLYRFASIEGYTISFASLTNVRDNAWHSFALTHTAGGVVVGYIDGAQVGTSTDSGVVTVPASTSIDFGYNPAEMAATSIAYLGQWTRVLAPSEVSWIAADPWIFYASTARRRTYSIPTGGAFVPYSIPYYYRGSNT